jgi:hypothetical protein
MQEEQECILPILTSGWHPPMLVLENVREPMQVTNERKYLEKEIEI